MAEIKLKKVNLIGEMYIHHFQKIDESGNLLPEILKVETTKEDHQQLAGPQPINPVRVGYKWTHSSIEPKYDTISGDLEDNQYVSVGNSIVLKVPGYIPSNAVIQDLPEELLTVVAEEKAKNPILSDKDFLVKLEYKK